MSWPGVRFSRSPEAMNSGRSWIPRMAGTLRGGSMFRADSGAVRPVPGETAKTRPPSGPDASSYKIVVPPNCRRLNRYLPEISFQNAADEPGKPPVEKPYKSVTNYNFAEQFSRSSQNRSAFGGSLRASIAAEIRFFHLFSNIYSTDQFLGTASALHGSKRTERNDRESHP